MLTLCETSCKFKSGVFGPNDFGKQVAVIKNAMKSIILIMQGNLLDRLRDFWSIGEDHGWDPECVIAELCEGIEGDNVNSAKPGASIAVFVNTFAKELKNRYGG